MATTTTTTLQTSLLLLFLLASSTHHRSQADTDDFITTTCKNTRNPGFCMSALAFDNRSTSAATAADLAGICIDVAMAHASSTVSHIDKLVSANRGKPFVEPLIKCVSLYGSAVYSLNNAWGKLKLQSYREAERLMSGAANALLGCEAAFIDVKSPITSRNQNVNDHSGLCSELVEMLVHA